LGIILRTSSASGFLKNTRSATRDVIFDESRKYHPDDLTFELSERVEEPLQTIGFPDHSELARGVESDEEEFETQSVADSVDSDQSSTG
jgi:hypothetical protein